MKRHIKQILLSLVFGLMAFLITFALGTDVGEAIHRGVYMALGTWCGIQLKEIFEDWIDM